jgi:hypothetical protein
MTITKIAQQSPLESSTTELPMLAALLPQLSAFVVNTGLDGS